MDKAMRNLPNPTNLRKLLGNCMVALALSVPMVANGCSDRSEVPEIQDGDPVSMYAEFYLTDSGGIDLLAPRVLPEGSLKLRFDWKQVKSLVYDNEGVFSTESVLVDLPFGAENTIDIPTTTPYDKEPPRAYRLIDPDTSRYKLLIGNFFALDYTHSCSLLWPDGKVDTVTFHRSLDRTYEAASGLFTTTILYKDSEGQTTDVQVLFKKIPTVIKK